MIVIAGKIHATISDWDAAQRQIDAIVAAVEAEAGCRAYRIYVDPADRNTLFLFEEWESAEALKRHRTQPHMAPFRAFLASIGAKSDLDRYEIAAKSKL
ncbi:MAG: antibiotic biosynthesis monooxygenase [Chloroflexi bacterium]|nr:antibiotic biosynthesis monooxygenase [Chloroflexota bacterium]